MSAWSRREFLKGSALAAASVVIAPRMVFGASGKASTRDVLIVVFQRGGMDSLNVVVPYADNDYYRLRPTIGIARPGSSATAVLPLDNFFGLNPKMAPCSATTGSRSRAASAVLSLPSRWGKLLLSARFVVWGRAKQKPRRCRSFS